jgi:hypothetical protein
MIVFVALDLLLGFYLRLEREGGDTGMLLSVRRKRHTT